MHTHFTSRLVLNSDGEMELSEASALHTLNPLLAREKLLSVNGNKLLLIYINTWISLMCFFSGKYAFMIVQHYIIYNSLRSNAPNISE